MIYRSFAFLVWITLWCMPSAGYVRLKGANGTFLYRPDYANIQLLLNNQVAPGMTNADGRTWITSDSDVAGALQGAINTWDASGSAAQFLPAQKTDLTASSPGHDVVMFLDSPAVRSALGPSTLAFTVNTYNLGGQNDGAIASAYIYFNPVIPLSTTLAPKTYDLQSILTHELGHVLGANHTGGIGSVMFQNINPNSTTWQSLSPDDVAFVSNVYPARPVASAYGSIAGTLSLAGGAPLRNALVNAVDTSSGIVFSGLTSGIDGTYSIPIPPGNYFVFAEPITGSINYNFYLCQPPQTGCNVDAIDSGFQPAFIGGSTPTPLAVSAGAVTNGDFSPPSGSPVIGLQYINTGAAAGYGDQSSLFSVAQALPVISGGSADIIMVGPGIDTTLADANVTLIGPVSLQPGTVRGDMWLLSNGEQFIRMTVKFAPVSRPTSATLVLSKNGVLTAFPGGLILLPPTPAPLADLKMSSPLFQR